MEKNTPRETICTRCFEHVKAYAFTRSRDGLSKKLVCWRCVGMTADIIAEEEERLALADLLGDR